MTNEEGKIQQWRQEYTWDHGGVFMAISKKDEIFIKMIGPYLRQHLNSRAWYLISLTENGASLTITVQDDTKESSGDNKEGS